MKKSKDKSILLAIDIGNTSITTGVFVGKHLVKTTRIPTKANEKIISKFLRNMLKTHIRNDIKSIISSVVPFATKKVSGILIKKLKLKPVILGRDLKVPIRNLYKEPSQVGQDRLVDAYACKRLYGVPAIIVDFGTATTIDYLNSDGAYEGGIITPGVEITINSLAENTALLPKIKLKKPRELIGKDTVDSIRSGVLNGLASMCDGLIEKIKKETKSYPKVIATGGLSGIFCHYSKHIKHIDQDLTLKGLYLIFSKNQP